MTRDPSPCLQDIYLLGEMENYPQKRGVIEKSEIFEGKEQGPG